MTLRALLLAVLALAAGAASAQSAHLLVEAEAGTVVIGGQAVGPVGTWLPATPGTV